MPKHQASLNYLITEDTVSSQYDLDGRLGMKIEIRRPKSTGLPLSAAAANYSAFRGLLVKSYIHFKGKAGFTLRQKGAATMTIGSLPRLQPLKDLDIDPDPFFTLFVPEADGLLDDYFESWFLTYAQAPTTPMEGMPSVVNLGLSEEWPPPPRPDSR
jgi:hypothetical protein